MLQSSWTLALRNSFKNFQKGCSKKKTEEASDPEPQPKRVKLHTGDEEEYIDDDEYQEALEKLKELGKQRKGRDHKELKRLMESTKLRHHSWIRKDCPLIQEVIDKFPCLSSSRWVRWWFYVLYTKKNMSRKNFSEIKVN